MSTSTGDARCHCTSAAPTCSLSAADANEAIRAFVANRTVWSPEALAELDRLRSVWAEARRREMTTAA